MPIFEPILQAVWATMRRRPRLSGPSLVAGRQMAAVPIELYSGEMVHGRGAGGFTEYLRRDSAGGFADTRYNFVSRDEATMRAAMILAATATFTDPMPAAPAGATTAGPTVRPATTTVAT